MKYLITLVSLALVCSACSKEEPAAPTEAVTAAEEQAVDTVDSAPDSSVPESESESLVVVEESAADPEPQDKSILLARADDPVEVHNWKYEEGRHFTRLVPTQPIVGGADKIEVAEVFMYSCPHCYDLEGHINRWEESKDPGVRLVRIPAVFNQLAQMHAQIYYTESFLAKSGKLKDQHGFRNMVFQEFHQRGNRLSSIASIQSIFERAGVSEDDFNRTWNSFEVNQALRLGADLARRYNIASVPAIIVNGKYKTDTGMAGGYPELIELIDELTVREGLR